MEPADLAPSPPPPGWRGRGWLAAAWARAAAAAAAAATARPGGRGLAGLNPPALPGLALAFPTLCLACRRWAGPDPDPDKRSQVGRQAAARRAAGLGRWPRLPLCPHCLQCALDARPAWAFDDPQAPALAQVFDDIVCALPYRPPWDGWVRALKYGGGLLHAAPMAALCAMAVQDALGDRLGEPPVVVPVPLSAPRRRARGYDQAWEIARRVARLLGCPALPDALHRHPTRHAQVGLGLEERMVNLRDAFEARTRRIDSWLGRPLLLVDDVLTTGATLDAAARALRRAGATTIHACTFARTPPPGS